MAYNLPPISTLSTVLGGEGTSDLQINSNLLDSSASQSNDQTTGNRNEINNQHQQWTTDSHYQVDESTGQLPWIDAHQQNETGEQLIDESSRPKKKPRARYSTTNADMTALINEATIAEYEDPGGDFRAGAVYVHPPNTVNQACVRCHRIKRKCDNAKPRCTGCWKSDTPCVFEISPATAAFVTSIKNEHNNTVNQLQIAQQRVSELEAQLSQSSSSFITSHGLSDPSGSTSQFLHPPSEVENYYTGFAQTILGIDHSSLITAQPLAQGQLPSLEIIQKAARTFFSAYERHHVFLNKGEFLVDLEDVWEAQGSHTESSSEDKRKEFLVMMVSSVGAHLCEAKGDLEVGTSKVLSESAMRNLGAATSKPDLITVQAYLALLSSVLLGLRPDINAHQVLALAMQTAISLDLHRKSTVPAADNELRKRIWWSIYNHDRSLAIGSGRSLGLADSEIDVELPCAQNEGEITDIAHFNRFIAHRRLLSDIHERFYTPGAMATTTVKSLELQQRLDNWLGEWHNSNDDQNSQSYGQLLAHQAAFLLHRPSPHVRVKTEEHLRPLGQKADEALLIYRKSDSTIPTSLQGLLWRYQTIITRLYVNCKTSDRTSRKAISDQIELCRKMVAAPPSFDASQALDKVRMVFERLVKYLLADQDEVESSPDEILFGLYRAMDVKEQTKGVQDQERIDRVVASDRARTPGGNPSGWTYHI